MSKLRTKGTGEQKRKRQKIDGKNKWYNSPRWSGEITDCSMPMTFDTYSGCSFNCLFCFAYFQKMHNVCGYLDKRVKSVNVEAVKEMFLGALSGNTDKLNNVQKQFVPYIQARKVMQWGGMADGFDNFERKRGVSLELLKFFDEIDYPLSISTKGVFFTEDERYMELIRRHAHNWHWKISIITLDPYKYRGIERGGVPSPLERIEAIRKLAETGAHVTLRLRPYIIGVSDDYRDLIFKARTAGADSVTTEFFCLEARADDQLRKKYEELSKFCGYDVWDFYKENSVGSGYRRLNYEIKRDIIEDMQQFTHSLGMRFYVSDAHHKEKSDFCCCCGVPPEWNVVRGHFAEALQIAKRNPDGTVRWSDICDDLKQIADHVPFYKANGFNTSSNRVRAKRYYQTLYDYVRDFWNTPKSAKSPYGYFEGVLYPIGLDDEGDVIYKLNWDKIRGDSYGREKIKEGN